MCSPRSVSICVHFPIVQMYWLALVLDVVPFVVLILVVVLAVEVAADSRSHFIRQQVDLNNYSIFYSYILL